MSDCRECDWETERKLKRIRIVKQGNNPDIEYKENGIIRIDDRRKTE